MSAAASSHRTLLLKSIDRICPKKGPRCKSARQIAPAAGSARAVCRLRAGNGRRDKPARGTRDRRAGVLEGRIVALSRAGVRLGSPASCPPTPRSSRSSFVFLSVRVMQRAAGRRRRSAPAATAALERRIRVHANFAEYVPLALILLGFLEMRGHAAGISICLCLALLAGPLAHAWGVSQEPDDMRLRGAGVALDARGDDRRVADAAVRRLCRARSESEWRCNRAMRIFAARLKGALQGEVLFDRFTRGRYSDRRLDLPDRAAGRRRAARQGGRRGGPRRSRARRACRYCRAAAAPRNAARPSGRALVHRLQQVHEQCRLARRGARA